MQHAQTEEIQMRLAEFPMGAIKRQGQEKLLPRFDDLLQNERRENVGRQL